MHDEISRKVRERIKKNDSSTVLKKVIFIGIGTSLAAVFVIEMLSPMARQTNEKRSQKQQVEREQASTEKQEQPDAPVVPQPMVIQPAQASGSDETNPAGTARP
jgi:hypothetical protein